MTNQNPIGEEIFSAEEIDRAISNIADDINQRFGKKPLTVLCVMTGALVFCGQLLPRLKAPLQLDYVHASRYGSSNTGSELRWIHTPAKEAINGQTVLIVDDLCDEGITLGEIKQFCLEQGAAEVYIVVLLDKGKAPESLVTPDFVGLQSDDRFLIGFGLDAQGLWRNLPAIYALND